MERISDDDEKNVGVSVMVQCATANLAAQQGHSWKGRVLLLSPTMVRMKMNIVTDCRIYVMIMTLIMLIKIFLHIMQNQLYLKFPLRSVETGQSNFNQNLPQCNHHPDLCLIHDTYSVTRGQKFCLLTILYTFAFNTKINNGLFLPLSMLSDGF